MDNVSLFQGQYGPTFASLRQLRSKFDLPSTYNRWRACSDVTSSLEVRPSTIWTVYDDEASAHQASQEKYGSKIFQILAKAVVQDYDEPTLNRADIARELKVMQDSCKGDTVPTIVKAIIDLFASGNQIPILGNTGLNVQLTLLASTVSKATAAINEKRKEKLL
ncbi:hypothetical protein DM01DRAFT_1337067 [Hesseltinella vesiculosa]|uniref:Uncharacterized protein n=1 Tax=Hesseltinella vesiculosa TaxID=101127 RepID=A0A1X2GDQ1_9FUNG|nr:hypothetical protein DM01DRAFT_1337067 [Hesseltinella vesiculosa]